MYSGILRKPDWMIENCRFDKANERYLPGENVTLSFDFKSLSYGDMYVANIGIQTDWMIIDGTWYYQPVNNLINPGQRRTFAFSFPIRDVLALGEYKLLFYVEAKHFPARNPSEETLTTMWTTIIVNIQYPITGEEIFLSHSINDKQLILELKNQMDNYGIKVGIGEDEHEPGIRLQDKFKHMIDRCTIFIAILTDVAMRSEWVLRETNYAAGIMKPCILLKDESISIATELEWTSFSKHGSSVEIFQIMMTAVDRIRQRNQNLLNSPIVGILGIAIASFLAGWIFRK